MTDYAKGRIAKQKAGRPLTGVGKGIRARSTNRYQRKIGYDKARILARRRREQLAKWTPERVEDEAVVLEAGKVYVT